MTDKEYMNKKISMVEEWKQVIYENELINYDVSNTGKIRNHETKFEYKLSKTPGMKNCYEFFQIKTSKGTRNVGIHRLMAIMFIPIPKKYLKRGINIKDLIVDHIDNVKYHNIISNLQWMRNRENIIKCINEKNLNDYLIDEKTVKKICKDLCNNLTIYDISKKYNISELLVHDIRFKIRYKNISKNYDFPLKQISEEDCVKICEELSKGKSSYKISKELGYPVSIITKILCGVTWTQISSKYTFPNKHIEKDMVITICNLLQDKKTIEEIHQITSVSKRIIERIRSRNSYANISKNYVFEYSKNKINDSVIHNICNDISSNKYTMKEIAKRNNVSLTFVKDIKYHKSRKDISDLYKW